VQRAVDAFFRKAQSSVVGGEVMAIFTSTTSVFGDALVSQTVHPQAG
jgi:hypothetical protein